ncbi:unnamed protein product, partial [Lampetra planeri]
VRVRASDDEDDEELILSTAVKEGAEVLPRSRAQSEHAAPHRRWRHSSGTRTVISLTSFKQLAGMRSLSSTAKAAAAELAGRSDSVTISRSPCSRPPFYRRCGAQSPPPLKREHPRCPLTVLAMHVHFNHADGIHQFPAMAIHHLEASALSHGGNYEAVT